jgi:arginyl-tRNA--protein-N-Asp/Glu arginylyltransferase
MAVLSISTVIYAQKIITIIFRKNGNFLHLKECSNLAKLVIATLNPQRAIFQRNARRQLKLRQYIEARREL